MKISNVKAVITGGASGLGLATAEHIVNAGGHVALLDIDDEQGAVSKEALGEHATFIRTDVSNEGEVHAAVHAANEAMGGINFAISCAGIATPGRALGREGPLPTATFNRVIQINLVGTFNLAKESAAIMQLNDPDENGDRGVIIGTASVAAFEGQVGQVAYSASKGGVVGMMLPLAREFAQFGIRVNTIAPGIFLTPMMAGMPDEIRDSLGRQVPYPQRLGKPSEFAQTAAFIAENAYLNGETIRVDGAIRMQAR